MSNLSLIASCREVKGKEKCKKLRTKGIVPAILYGGGESTEKLIVNEHELSNLLRATRGKFSIIELQVESKPELAAKVMLRDIQRDPVTHDLIHADFLRLSDKKAIKLSVPVHIIGSAVGVKEGGILEHITRELEIRAIPSKVPPFIEVDVTNLGINKSIHVKDLTLPEGIEIIDTPDTPIAHVAMPRLEAEAAPKPAEGEEVKEPELIEKKKKEEGEEEEVKEKEKEKK